MGKNQHVVPHKEGWAVKGEGASRATSIEKTQQEAISLATSIAKTQKSELFIHGENGRIRARNSYGSDPYPPQG